MKKLSILLSVVLLLTALAGCGAGKKMPLKDLRGEEISAAKLTLTPPDTAVTLTGRSDLEALAVLLRAVILYEQDDAGRETEGQLVSYEITKTDGSTLTLGAYGSYIYLDGVCYRAEYAPSQALSSFGNDYFREHPDAGKATEAPGTAAPQSPAAEPEPRFIVSSEQYQETFLDDDGVTVLLNAAYAMPVVTIDGSAAASASVNEVLAARREAFLHSDSEYDTSVDSALAEAKFIRGEGYAGEPFAMEQSFCVPRADSAVLSIFNIYYTFLGGVHPNSVWSAVSFDTAGNMVSLDDLSGDPAAFRDFCTEKVTALAEAADGQYVENYRELIPDNIRDGMWYFSAEGLTFIYNAYDIAPYAAGPSEFTIPYSQLGGVMDDRWQPHRGDVNGTGTVRCDYAENVGAYTPLFALETDPEGAELAFLAQGTVRELQLSAAADTGEGYAEGALLACVSRLDDGEGFSLRYLFPGDMSCLRLQYTAEGRQWLRYIWLSGEDGSVLMR